MAELSELARRFRASGHDPDNRSPFSAGLDRNIAEHPEILELLRAAPDQQQLPVLLRAAVHAVVLDEPDSELAQWYPTVTVRPRATDPFPAFARCCDQHAERIRAIVARRVVQTNEVGRCALLVPALGQLAAELGPLGLVDVGTSAGLNLHLDRYEYRYSPGGRIGPVSAVRIETATSGDLPVPALLPTIDGRVGLDRAPLDVNDPDDARWLLACVWPDQADRFERLAAAIDIARRAPVTLVRGDAVDHLAIAVRRLSGRGHPVVINTWVLNYLPDERRDRYVDELDAIGATRDLSWVFAESPRLCAGLPFADELRDVDGTVLTLVRWRDGTRTVTPLGTAHPHGYWIRWTFGAGDADSAS